MALAASLLLSAADPSGDAYGDGSYQLPTRFSSEERDSLDLRSFEVRDNAGFLQFEIGMGANANPLESPRGFSVPVIDVFIKTASGGVLELGDLGFSAPIGSGWQQHLRFSGFDTVLEELPQGADRPVRADASGIRIQAQGSRILVDTRIPSGEYSYWVASRVFDPLTPKGYQEPGLEAGPYTLSAPASGMPSAVDVLVEGPQAAAYRDRRLPAIGKLRDDRPYILLAIGAVSLLLAIVATIGAWRR